MASPPRKSAALPGASLLLPAWEWACRASLAGFHRRLQAGPGANRDTLRGILERHAGAEVGRRLGFHRLVRYRDLESAWREALPVADYEGFRADIQRMAAGEPDVLFPGRPRLFVSTSGTTGDPKLFPVTRRQQNAALGFIALTLPAARAAAVPGLGFRQPTATLMVASRPGRATAAGIPVGNPSGAGIRRILALAPPFWVFPPQVLTVADYPTALYLHALFALRAADLGCIEAIYCSHIVNWMGVVEQRRAELLADLAGGNLSRDLVLSAAERRGLAPFLAPDPARARMVERALDQGGDGLMARLWPGLKVLSAVVSGAFAVSVPRLRQLAGPGPAFYTTAFGATEGMVGLNLRLDQPERYAFALGACHFEFIPAAELESPSPRAVGMDQVETGGLYELVITNHAGLYRYRLGDVVRITAREGATPVFEFHHRRGNVIDLVGEKTTEQHIRTAMGRLAREQLGDETRLLEYTVYPDLGAVPYRYVAYAELGPGAPLAPSPGLAVRLDELLAEVNPAYRTLARANGRLAPVRVQLVRPGTFARLQQRQREAAEGINANQVKVPRVLRDPAGQRLLEEAGC